jgi:hypothetical protein
LARFGWIWLDLAGFGWIFGVAKPSLKAIVSLVDEGLAEGGGPLGIAAKRRKNTRSFAFFAPFRGYFMVCRPVFCGCALSRPG